MSLISLDIAIHRKLPLLMCHRSQVWHDEGKWVTCGAVLTFVHSISKIWKFYPNPMEGNMMTPYGDFFFKKKINEWNLSLHHQQQHQTILCIVIHVPSFFWGKLKVNVNTHTKEKPATINWQFLQIGTALRGYCTPNQKQACFVLYFKIIDTFLKSDIWIL